MKAAFHPTHRLSLPKKPRYWLRGRGLLINLNLSRHGDFFFFSLLLSLQRTRLPALVSTLSLQLSPHLFPAFLGIGSLDGNSSSWQLCAHYAWGKKHQLSQTPLPPAAASRCTVMGRRCKWQPCGNLISGELEQLRGFCFGTDRIDEGTATVGEQW